MFEVDHYEKRKPSGGQSSARGQELASLDASALRDRFYSWRGASGNRYVCSIFPSSEEKSVADFSGALIIGVAHVAGSRRPVCLLSSREFREPDGLAVRDDARSLGVNEWHARFDADLETVRDLALSLLN